MKWPMLTVLGIAGCIVVAANGWPEIAYVIPGSAAFFGIIAMVTKIGLDDAE